MNGTPPGTYSFSARVFSRRRTATRSRPLPGPSCWSGTLAEQLARADFAQPTGALPPRRRPPVEASVDAPRLRPEIEFFNGLGGFGDDGREYITVLGPGQWTPAPWINVIANPGFGFLVSESGAGYTWALNSRENQLTPWSNNPVSDPAGEAIYVRDEEFAGTLWGPTALPIREEAWPYLAQHGQGYSRFEHTAHGIALHLLQFVPLEDPLKISRLTIENRSGRSRRLSATGYAEWVLGAFGRARGHARGRRRSDTHHGDAARPQPLDTDFPDRVAFVDLGGQRGSTPARPIGGVYRTHGSSIIPRPCCRAEAALPDGYGAGLDPVHGPAGAFDLPRAASATSSSSWAPATIAGRVDRLDRRYPPRRIVDAVELRTVTTLWDHIVERRSVEHRTLR